MTKLVNVDLTFSGSEEGESAETSATLLNSGPSILLLFFHFNLKLNRNLNIFIVNTASLFSVSRCIIARFPIRKEYFLVTNGSVVE